MCTPQIEAYWGNVNPIGLRSCYDEGKAAPKRCSSIIDGNIGSASRLLAFLIRMVPACIRTTVGSF